MRRAYLYIWQPSCL